MESDLSIAYWRSRDVVNDQKESISKVLHSISDLVPVRTFTTEDVERQLDQANRAQTKMSEEVRDLDRTLLNEYQQVISDVPQIVSLYSALEDATRQGADVEPLHFNAEAFYHSETYKIQGDLEKQTAAYLSFKKQQEQARQVSKKEEKAANRPRYEKTGSELEKTAHIYDEVNDGIDDGVFDTVKDTVVGLWDMAKSPQETAENIVHAVRHPVKTTELLANALSNSFEKNMVHGNAYTRTHWITYAIATIALSLLGTKGIDKVGKMVDVGKLAEKASQAGTVTKSMFAEKTSAVAGKINGFQNPFTPKYQFAGGNVPYNTIDSSGLRDKLLKITNGIGKNNFNDYINNTNHLQQVSAIRVDGFSNRINTSNIYWNRTSLFKKVKVYQRDDIINPNLKDARGRTNIERMKRGLAPIGTDGKSINLHHTTQQNESSIAEVTQTFHKENSYVIHINPNTMPSGINRIEFNKWRSDYWKNRANDFDEKKDDENGH
ncbi:MAG: HNH/ENDO VII family nuclease [Sporolactobacillus sp.]